MPELVPSPLLDRHEALGARLGEFAGWRMPIAYEGTVAEHTAVREAAGVFDVSHLGTVWITGPGALGVVDMAFTNDPRGLADGESQYSLCASDEGGVVDDLIVYRIAEDRWMAVPNAANTSAVVHRLESVTSATGARAAVDDRSTDWAVLAVQGPTAFAAISTVLGVDGAALRFGQHTSTTVDDAEVRVCRTGYTGEKGVELVLPIGAAGPVWDALMDAGVVPCGLAARDTLRLEMGYPLHGNELARDISPYEARCGWAVKLDGRSFVGHEALAAAKEAGPQRRTWGLLADGRRPPRTGMVVSRDGLPVGRVTSGSFSPTLGVGIGMALLDVAVGDGDLVTVDVRGTDVAFTVARPPMVDRDPR